MSTSYDLAPNQAAPSRAVVPKNPSYPERVHVAERPRLEGILRDWEARIAEAKRKLDVLGPSADRPKFERLYAQMLGARDQIAEAVRRMPMEVGDLYEEDEHRLHEAVAALERLFKAWG
ncbi:hypothetical protein [Tautonia sociabilis]|uniref:Uncharacterized protein n=1 Tax=Tautonia sociabilis TaxID=2080755 RepID=A0A432MCP8_9BACT|nr:hypothetical protein [Tautonia sociabilis]RUL82084.1 hypothetical protein TsocGM_24025 [Tautonia sociabilis]